MGEQSPLDLLAESEASQRTVCADHAMARHDQADRIRGIGSSDGARRIGYSELRRQLAVADSFTKGNFPQRSPYAPLKLGSRRREPQGERTPFSREIFLHLFSRFAQPGSVAHEMTFSEPVAELNRALAAPEFLDLLSYVFEIPRLLADEQLVGGGIHQTGPRGHLDVHIDFNYIRERELHRRLNILIYFNKDWAPQWGGNIELWDKEVKVRHHSPLRAKIVEYRGPLGPGGAHIYCIRIGRKPKPLYVEVREDQLTLIPPKPATPPAAGA